MPACSLLGLKSSSMYISLYNRNTLTRPCNPYDRERLGFFPFLPFALCKGKEPSLSSAEK